MIRNTGMKIKATTVATGPREANKRDEGTTMTGTITSSLTFTAPFPMTDGRRHRSANVFRSRSTRGDGTP